MCEECTGARLHEQYHLQPYSHGNDHCGVSSDVAYAPEIVCDMSAIDSRRMRYTKQAKLSVIAVVVIVQQGPVMGWDARFSNVTLDRLLQHGRSRTDERDLATKRHSR